MHRPRDAHHRRDGVLATLKEVDLIARLFLLADLASPSWTEAIAPDGPYDAVVSGFTIHHLPDERKRQLYAEIASIEEQNGAPEAARTAFAATGLAADQCAVMDAPPRMISGVGASDFPQEALRWGFEGWAQVHIRYYLFAYLYVIFAVDAVFLFPWATVFAGLGWVSVAEMGIFVGFIAVGLVYAWRKGVLAWT